MPPKITEASEKKSFSKVPFPLTKSQVHSLKTPSVISVRPAKKIPRKIFNFFKVDLKTGRPLEEKKQAFLAQVTMHEIEEGIRILEKAGRDEQARLLKRPNGALHLSHQIHLLREWLDQEPIRERPPERVQDSFKLRNNQNGEMKASLREGEVCGFTSQGIFYKDRNEDALLVVPERGVMAVMDGMGGHVGGNIASGIFADFFEYALRERMLLEKATEYANEAVVQRTRNDPRFGGSHPMGTTLVCAEIRGDTLRCIHVGDSKLAVIREGKIVHETQDHTNGQDLWRDGMVDLETAHSLNHILSRSLGCDSIFANRDLDRSDLILQKGDRILLASDGITDNFFAFDFSLNELAELAGQGTPSEAIEVIRETCLERIRKGSLPDGQVAKPDNLTFLLYEHGG